MQTPLACDRGHIREIILNVSPRTSQETFDISRQWTAKEARVKLLIQKNNSGIGWACREGIEAASGNPI